MVHPQPEPPVGAHPPQPKKKRGKFVVGCLAIAVVFLVIIGACAAIFSQGDGTAAPGVDQSAESVPGDDEVADEQSGESTEEDGASDEGEEVPAEQEEDAADDAGAQQVEWIVTSTGPANVAYGTLSGSSTTDIDSGEWTESDSLDNFDGLSLTVTASDFEANDSEVTCEIRIDGETVAEQSGSGQLASASCSATTGW